MHSLAAQLDPSPVHFRRDTLGSSVRAVEGAGPRIPRSFSRPHLIPAIFPEMTLDRRYELEVALGQESTSRRQRFVGIWEIGGQQQKGTPDLRSPSGGPSRGFEARARMDEIHRSGVLTR